MALQTRPFDASEYLDSPEDIQAYLADALESVDFAEIASAIGVVAKALGMATLARKAGLTSQGLYKTLSPTGNPDFATILKVTNALGCRRTSKSRSEESPEDV
jgi:probable addiction module antidote protein